MSPEVQDGAMSELRLAGQRLTVVGTARMYVCGITPYDVTHLGHAATFVWADVAASVLRTAGVQVAMCRNVTDVDDVLTDAAEARGRAYDEFALHQQYLFERDMTALAVHPPAYEPRARHHIRHVQQLASALLAAGAADESDGSVVFRDEANGDVPVWVPSTGEQPAWPSPWGPGRPGWHAECAAMALSVLGNGIDIVAGGADLALPHHAYQAAMAEAATGVGPFARSALHVGAVYQDGAKMAKSTGNLTLVADLLEDYPPAAIRLLILDRRWSAPWTYERPALERAAGELDELYAAAAKAGATDKSAVTAALLDDLDVPRALAIAREDGGEAARHLLRVLSLI
jgi:L-cysteine:1D-myo-inositol 2-amino-2-deoxy-alpha-D-glucopyranoside ligase